MPAIAIIGAGIGGLCTALGLRQAGFEVRVFEKAPAIAPVGAGLTSWLNALRCLDALGLGDEFRQLAPASFAQILDWQGKSLSRLDAARLHESFGFPARTLHRADLHSLLLRAVGTEHISLGQELASGDQDDDCVLLGFANGEEQRYDLVIAADGIDSVARKIFLPRSPSPKFAGYLAWRGIASLAAEELPGGSGFEAWGRGCRFGALPLPGDRVYWFATENSTEGSSAPDARRQHLLNVFGHWLQPIPQLLQGTDESELLRHDVYDLPELATWSRGRVVLLGDAAHATTPNMGQGACQAIEDSVVLARELRQDPTPLAFGRFEALRRRRTRQIVRLSRRIGAMGQLENPLLCWLRNTAMRSMPPSLALRQLKDLLSFDPLSSDPLAGS